MLDTLNVTKINGQNILITGGTGSFGQTLVKILLEQFQPNKLIIYSRDEYKQSLMKQRFDPKKYPCLRYFIGDVRDVERMKFAFQNVDIVFHTSALKRIEVCEYNPMEAVNTNIIGTQNVVLAAIDQKVKYVIGLSTDKACAPVNQYGATKLCAEKLLINGNILTNDTKFSVCRYGNQFNSRGSVIEIFQKMIDQDMPLTITSLEMTRFTILLSEAVNFVLNCLEIMVGGEIFVPKLPSYSLEQLVRCLSSVNNKKKLAYELIGLRPGEKLHEMMISQDESSLVYTFEHFLLMLPLNQFNIKPQDPDVYGLDYHKYEEEKYSSGDNQMIEDQRLIEFIQMQNSS